MCTAEDVSSQCCVVERGQKYFMWSNGLPKYLVLITRAARVTVVVLCVCVCLSVKSHLTPMEGLFVLKTQSRTQRATKLKTCVGICLKRLRSRVMPRNMSEKANMLIIPTYPRSAFSA